MIQTNVTIAAPVALVWDAYNTPKHIQNWNFASDDWFCPSAQNDLRVGGSFKNRMEAKDGSFGFDFEGVYTLIEPNTGLHFTLLDGRKVEMILEEVDDKTNVTVAFEPEAENPEEMQQQGWQAILNNFKTYTEQLYGKA
jgi:uncharacterized protein YndB with AHSA1/START domain